MVGSVFTRCTVRTLGEALEGSGFLGPFALALGGYGFVRWLRCHRTSAWPDIMQHDAEPKESQDRELVVDMVRNHGDAPFPGGVTGTF